MKKTKEYLAPRHIGDGVYVHHVPGGIELAVNNHENRVIFMEPSVIDNFINYLKQAGEL